MTNMYAQAKQATVVLLTSVNAFSPHFGHSVKTHLQYSYALSARISCRVKPSIRL